MISRSFVHSVLVGTLVAFGVAGSPTARAQVGLDGRVMEVTNPARIALGEGVRAPLGTTVHVYKIKEVGGQQVGVLAGTYRALTQRGASLHAEPRGGVGVGVEVGDRVEVAPSEGSTLTVDSVPSGAAVSWNGHPLGTTPLQLEVASGDHLFAVTADGYDPAEARVAVEVGRMQTVSVALTAPLPATQLYLRAEVAFAAGRYADAEDFARRATAAQADGSLSEEEARRLPAYLAVSGIGKGIAERAGAIGLTPEGVLGVMSKVRFIYENGDRHAVVASALSELELTIALDPSWPTIRAMAAAPPPPPPAPQ